jgi:hypothetical protein
MALRGERGAGQRADRGHSSTLGHGATDVCERRVEGTFCEILTPMSAMRVAPKSSAMSASLTPAHIAGYGCAYTGDRERSRRR